MVVTRQMIDRCEAPQQKQSEANLRLFSVGGLLLSAVLTIAGCAFQGIENHWWRTSFFLMATAPLVASKVASDELTIRARAREDRTDVFTQARQDNLYKYLTQPQQAPEQVIEPVEELPVHYLSGLLSSELKSTMLLGAPRAGKGYAMAKAVELLPDNVSLWAIDPKNDHKEDHYWSRFPASQITRFDCTVMSREAVASRVVGMWERFMAAPSSADNPKLLIIDETAPGLASKEMNMSQAKAAEASELAGWFKLLMKDCAVLASVGPSLGRFVWILSQASTGEDLGISNGSKGGYRIVAVGNKKTANSWYQSVNSSLKIGLPSEQVLGHGYIQNDGTGWGVSRPFQLTPAYSDPTPTGEGGRPSYAPEQSEVTSAKKLQLLNGGVTTGVYGFEPSDIESYQNESVAISPLLALVHEQARTGKFTSAFIKEQLGMEGRHYATARKLLELLFIDQADSKGA